MLHASRHFVQIVLEAISSTIFQAIAVDFFLFLNELIAIHPVAKAASAVIFFIKCLLSRRCLVAKS
jgi:hypothetical protein